MMANVTFAGLDSYKLTGVQVTERQLGHGSYATVQELGYMGLKCAGKKIHDVLLEQGDTSYSLRRFEEECYLLSQVRHPNIVQFLGVHFQPGVRAPILVMEFLPTNLTSCIEQYGILPKEISYSILHDVALGLCYLHSQTPPIIHRDLSSNNVLLTSNMTGKISDLGVARILNLTPLQVSRMTNTPGTPAYMPPEAMVANPRYDASIDEFSYGILMIHMFSGQWPEPQVGPNQIKDGNLVPVTEAERREKFFQMIGEDHPLMDLIQKCVSNDPLDRAHVGEIVKRLAEITSKFPASFTNRLDMLLHIEHQEEEKSTLKKVREEENRQNKQKISILAEESQDKSAEITRLNHVFSSEVEQLKLQLKDATLEHGLLEVGSDAQLRELKTQLTVYQAQIEKCEEMLKQERKAFKTVQEKERATLEMKITEKSEEFKTEKKKLEAQLVKERELCRELTNENHQLRAESKMETDSLQQKISTLTADVSRKAATIERKESELDAKTRALNEKSLVISRMNQQLTGTREYLTSKLQAVRATISWKQCADAPVKLSGGSTTAINDKVYHGGGGTENEADKYMVYCYDHPQDSWTTLPPLPVRRFGLGQVGGKLVAVGGVRKEDGSSTNEIYTYKEATSKWRQTIPPMPTARYGPGVLSLQSALIVAGGVTSAMDCTDRVEIFMPETSQWHTTTPLPKACRGIALVATDNTCYMLRAYVKRTCFNKVYYASIDELLCNAVADTQTSRSDSSDNSVQSWKSLSDTPTYGPGAAVLYGHPLIIGGDETSVGGSPKKGVYTYSHTVNSWIYVSDLPADRSTTAAVSLSPTEVLVIGGWHGKKVHTVYKGTLQLKL